MASEPGCAGRWALLPVQERAVEWMRARENDGSMPYGGVLADDVGMGKTHIVAGLLRDAPLWPVLIVVPKSLIVQWADVLRVALAAEGHVPMAATCARSLSCVTLADLVLTTHSQLPTPAASVLVERLWARVVVDEAHEMKNPKTRLHRVVRDMRAHSKWLLTATPVQNSPADLFALGRVIGVQTTDVELLRAKYMLRRVQPKHRVGDGEPSPGGQDDEPEEGEELPPLHVRNVLVPLQNVMEQAAYEEAKSALESLLQDHGTAAPLAHDVRAMERLLRCRQACTHPAIYHSSMAAKAGQADAVALQHELQAQAANACPRGMSSKLDFLCDDIEAHSEMEQLLVFCEWRSEMAVLQRMLAARGITPTLSIWGGMEPFERADAISYFTSPGSPVRVMLLQVRCGACGLNLQSASRVYFTRPHWNPAVERQAIGRAHRRGQSKAVTVVRLIAQGTVDEECIRRQGSKLRTITKLLHDASMERALLGTAGDGSSA